MGSKREAKRSNANLEHYADPPSPYFSGYSKSTTAALDLTWDASLQPGMTAGHHGIAEAPGQRPGGHIDAFGDFVAAE